jgi:hypothetical protein
MLMKENDCDSQKQFDKMLFLYSHIKQLKSGTICSPFNSTLPREVNIDLALSFFIRGHHVIDWANSPFIKKPLCKSLKKELIKHN